MPAPHDPFSPQRVDESISSLSAAEPAAQTSVEPDARLVRDMQRLYGLERKQYLRALQRVEKRLIARHLPTDEQPTASLEVGQPQIPGKSASQGGFSTMDDRGQPTFPPPQQAWMMPSRPAQGNGYPDGGRQPTIPPPQGQAWTNPPHPVQASDGRRQARSAWRLARLLVAALVTLTLIGSMIFVLHTLNPGATPGTQSVTPTPSRSPISSPTSAGRKAVMYSTPSDSNFAHGLAWSPDGARLAVLNQENVQIWDALTGGHRLTIPASGEPPVNDYLAWSPNGKWLAIVSNSEITIVNAQTGGLAHQFLSSSLAEIQPASPGSSLSTLHLESGGGVNLDGLVWSPDSRLLAVTTGSILASARHFLILNAQTGAVVHRFPETASNWITVASWSSDGKYLAAVVMSAGSQSEEEAAWAWNISTYQVVFKQHIGSFSPGVITLSDQLVWQPRSDNLALASGVGAGWDASGVALWDVAHDHLLKSYAQPNTNLLTWSPDGKYLALVVQKTHVDTSQKPAKVTTDESIVALDAQSGQRVTVSQPESTMSIAVIAWSPNGKYIATGPSNWPAPIQVLSAPSA